MRSISRLSAIVLLASSLLAFGLTARAQRGVKAVLSAPIVSGTMYGINKGSGNASVYQIDRLTGAISNSHSLTLAGFTIDNALSLATRPTDGVLFADLQVTPLGGSLSRRLVTVNPSTGVCTDIGPFGAEAIAYLAFRPSTGVLYAVSGQKGANPSTLFTVNQTTGALTVAFLLANGAGAGGETIAFGPNGVLYHSAGSIGGIFERVDVDTQAVTPLGPATTEAFAMGFSDFPRAMYLSDINGDLYTVDLNTGARTLVGPIGTTNNRGLAVVGQPTAANVTISGRVVSSSGAGVRAARVTITDSRGHTFTAISNAFGYYTFASVPSGDSYVANATSRGMTFSPRVVGVTDAVAGLDLVAR